MNGAARSERPEAPRAPSPLQIWRRAQAEAWRTAAPELPRFALAMALTVTLTTFIFQPAGMWPLAFICLAPWCAVVLRSQHAWVAHWGSFLGGYVFFLINLAWLMPVTGLGYAALALYLAMYWVLAAWAVRTAARAGVGPTWTLPVVWVATEYLRSWVMSGFPWLFIGHAFYRQTHLIQISDLTGAYGVSFMALVVNGALAELWIALRAPATRRSALRRKVLPIASAAVVVFATIGYGNGRLATAELRPGPRVAVIQEDFPLVSTPPYGDHPVVILARYLALAAKAADEHPDIIAFPETAWSAVQNIGFLSNERLAVDNDYGGAWALGKRAHDATSAFASGDYAAVNRVLTTIEEAIRAILEKRGERLPRLPPDSGRPATVLIGAVSIEKIPGEAYRYRRANSALLYDPDGEQRLQRYDKVHLVPFGEAVPFRNTRLFGVSLHWLYRWLNSLSPFSDGGKIDYSLWPGEQFTVFDFTAADGVSYRFGVPICYEDVMPYVPRRFVWGPDGEKRVDFLINISNDGWFLYSAELEQHLAICTFRAVENRVTIARAVNTGISGFIDPNGRIYGLVEREGKLVGPGVVGVSVEHVMLDDRRTVYGRHGDWFAGLCLLLAVPLWIGGVVTRWAFGIWNHLVLRKPRPAEED